MSQDEAWLQLARECPRKILGALHRQGRYVHGTSSRFPGKVLCFHCDSPLPADWTPTPAQSVVSECYHRAQHSLAEDHRSEGRS